MNSPTNVGVIGCGYWGPNLVRNFRAVPDCKVKAMCDLNVARLNHLRTLYPDIEGMTDYQHFLNGLGLDAVVIATPVKHHYPLAKASLLAGKHTFVEKPMASSSEECEELIDIAQRNGLVLMIGHTFLYSAPVRKIVGDRPGRRHWRHPLHQFSPAQSRSLPERYQRRVGSRAPRHLHHPAHPGGVPVNGELPGQRARHSQYRGRDQHVAHIPPEEFATIQSSWLEPAKFVR